MAGKYTASHASTHIQTRKHALGMTHLVRFKPVETVQRRFRIQNTHLFSERQAWITKVHVCDGTFHVHTIAPKSVYTRVSYGATEAFVTAFTTADHGGAHTGRHSPRHRACAQRTSYTIAAFMDSAAHRTHHNGVVVVYQVCMLGCQM